MFRIKNPGVRRKDVDGMNRIDRIKILYIQLILSEVSKSRVPEQCFVLFVPFVVNFFERGRKKVWFFLRKGLA